MPLIEEMERTGNWLFRYRSFVPFALLIPMLLAMGHFEYVGNRHELQEVWAFACLAISFVGLAIRVLTVGYAPRGTSGRNTSGQRAEQLNTTGMYSIVRHPLYLGNFIIWLGVSMFLLHWWFVAVFALLYFIYYERIILAEERFLRSKFGAAFEAWAGATPAVLPNVRQWRRAELAFSWRTVAKREFYAFFGIVAAFFALEVAEHILVEHVLTFERHWTILFAVACIAFVVLRTLKKHTTFLAVDGR